MILIGMFDSPFVRRVAVSMNVLGIAFEHRNWSVGKDFELIRQFNPLGRVPTLVLPDGEALIDSAAILDCLDEYAGPERALLPRSGKERREALRIVAVATGAAEKGVVQVYESAFRPPEKRHRPWMERCHAQMREANSALDSLAQTRASAWLGGSRLNQAAQLLSGRAASPRRRRPPRPGEPGARRSAGGSPSRRQGPGRRRAPAGRWPG